MTALAMGKVSTACNLLLFCSRPRLVGGCCLLLPAYGFFLTAVCIFCYGSSLRGEFVHDDVWAITNNLDVRPGSSLRNVFLNDFWGKRMADNTSHKSYRPLCILTFQLNVYLADMAPYYFHLINIVLHCAVTALLMYTCNKAVFKDNQLAFFTALLFAVHPVHTEAVAGIVGRADVLACLLFLLAFLSYIRSVDQSDTGEHFPPTTSPLYFGLSLFLGTCGMLVKETGVTVFGVCLAYDLGVLCQKNLKRCGSADQSLLKVVGPFVKRAVILTSYVIVILCFRLWIMDGSMPLFSEQDNPASFSPSRLTRFLTYSYLLVFNALLLLAPITLCYDWQVGSIPLVESVWDPRNIATVLFGFIMILLCLHCLTAVKKLEHREVLVGLLFLVFPFVPASNLFFRVGFVVAERVLYMPSMGYCILVVHGLNKLCSLVGRCGVTAVTVSTFILLLLFSWKTVEQNKVWLSRESLFRSGVQTLPHNAKVHYNYANFLKDQGRNDEAIYHYKTALKLFPRHASALNNLGTLTSDPVKSEEYYRQALQINPQHNRALFNLGNLLKALNVARNADILSPLGALYYNTGRYEEALQVYKEATILQPENSEVHLALAQVLAMVGKVKDAEKLANHIAEKHAKCVECYRLLSAIYSKQEKYNKALEAIEKALKMKPKDMKVIAELYFSKGNQLRELNLLDKAFENSKVAVHLNSEQAQAWMNMGGIQHIKFFIFLPLTALVIIERTDNS
ncbi:protein O-mannosyl-transferase TMTC1 [Protopterus annectens]|uniref:protein O-mannosyl-transferase TMTC1 n=1 Tax=Protopterus annectens TaxID=7888 RepID=UPI001CFA0643|nr:protein O-mannosyl-transferase TMTC1 [Protopterus annectens]